VTSAVPTTAVGVKLPPLPHARLRAQVVQQPASPIVRPRTFVKTTMAIAQRAQVMHRARGVNRPWEVLLAVQQRQTVLHQERLPLHVMRPLNVLILTAQVVRLLGVFGVSRRVEL